MSTTNNWFARLTAGSASWANRDAYNTIVESTLSCRYSLLSSVYQNSATPTYSVLADIGSISGAVILPAGSAELALSCSYKVLVTSVTKDLVPSFDVINSADRTTEVVYNVKWSAVVDRDVTYQLGGYVERDLGETYTVRVSTEQDSSEVTYDVIESVYIDVSPSYTVITNPLTAAQNASALYQVLSTVKQDGTVTYRLVNTSEQDLNSEYTIHLGVEEDKTVTYALAGSSTQDAVVTYLVLGQFTATQDSLVRYNIVAPSNQVPNVIGYTLPKAKRILESAGFVLGQVTYQ